MEYYNGLVFQGYLKALPRPLLKGGRYDLLLQKFTPGAGAIGFAVYLDELDRLNAMPPVQHQDTGKVMLNVALPKGRLGDKVYNLLAGIGYGCPEDYNATRKLVVENPAAGIRYFLVKPSDVAIYVEHGAADVGIVGKDILTEAAADVYELLDTGGPYMAGYYASKAYVVSLTRGVAEELREMRSPVYVCALCPGPVDTEFNDHAGVVFALRGITPELCVEEALLGMMHRKTIIVPSAFMRLCTSAQRLVPIPLLMPIVARQQKKKLG